MNLGVDPRHADQMVRGVCALPHGSGRKLRVGVFAKGAKAEEAKKAGADVVGAEDLVEQVQKGVIDFDRCIATPDMMPLVGRLGKVLGPARPDAEPEGRHGDRGCRPRPCARRRAARSSSASRRPGIDPCRCRQGELQRAGAGREHPRLRRCGDEGEAVGRQGHVLETRRGDLDDGTWCEDRAHEPGWRRRRGLILSFGTERSVPKDRLHASDPKPVRDCRCGKPLKPFGPA